MSVGVDSTIAPLFVVGALATVGSARYMELVGALAVLVVVFVVVGLLRLGWIEEFLSAQ
jgi:MFS superfamily sulfate permease-like transporter